MYANSSNSFKYIAVSTDKFGFISLDSQGLFIFSVFFFRLLGNSNKIVSIFFILAHLFLWHTSNRLQPVDIYSIYCNHTHRSRKMLLVFALSVLSVNAPQCIYITTLWRTLGRVVKEFFSFYQIWVNREINIIWWE